MKITRNRLKRIISEELQRVLVEQGVAVAGSGPGIAVMAASTDASQQLNAAPEGSTLVVDGDTDYEKIGGSWMSVMSGKPGGIKMSGHAIFSRIAGRNAKIHPPEQAAAAADVKPVVQKPVIKPAP